MGCALGDLEKVMTPSVGHFLGLRSRSGTKSSWGVSKARAVPGGLSWGTCQQDVFLFFLSGTLKSTLGWEYGFFTVTLDTQPSRHKPTPLLQELPWNRCLVRRKSLRGEGKKYEEISYMDLDSFLQVESCRGRSSSATEGRQRLRRPLFEVSSLQQVLAAQKEAQVGGKKKLSWM